MAPALWKSLENEIFRQVNVADLRIALVGGPIFASDDRPFVPSGAPAGTTSVRIPRQFFKVAAYRDNADGKVKALAFRLSQADLVAGDLDERLDLSRFEMFQVTVTELETLTGLRMTAFRRVDTQVRGEAADRGRGRTVGAASWIVRRRRAMTVWASPRFARASPLALAAILLVALVLRLHLAGTEAYVHDESANSIPLSKTISFTPGQLELPLRGQNHGALPAYVVKASSTLFGTTPLGYRFVHVLLSLLTVVLVYRFAREQYGPQAGLWAAALLALNEYYLAVSARATAHVPHLFFVTAAVLSFGRFLVVQRAAYLYAAAAFTGLAFYCKEHSALLVPVFLLSLLHPVVPVVAARAARLAGGGGLRPGDRPGPCLEPDAPIPTRRGSATPVRRSVRPPTASI